MNALTFWFYFVLIGSGCGFVALVIAILMLIRTRVIIELHDAVYHMQATDFISCKSCKNGGGAVVGGICHSWEPVCDMDDKSDIIRCKECRYFRFGDYCTEAKMEHSQCREDDFCSYAEMVNAQEKLKLESERA